MVFEDCLVKYCIFVPFFFFFLNRDPVWKCLQTVQYMESMEIFHVSHINFLSLVLNFKILFLQMTS